MALVMLLAMLTAASVTDQSPIPVTPQAADAILDLQVRLDRASFSPGEIDGRPGANTWKALTAFQKAKGLRPTGRPDAATLAALAEASPGDTVVAYQVTAEDVAGPFIDAVPEDMMERAKLAALGYTSPLEQLSERLHASPKLLQRLNPKTSIAAGATLRVPNVNAPPRPTGNGTRAPGGKVTVTVSKSQRALTVAADDGRVLLHAPVTVGSQNDPLPIGDWKVTGVQRDPVFHYNPDLFWDADPSHAKAKVPAGPNNPVGVVWVDLSRPHYGIHGTPEPSHIGRTESHGCVRLTNWDALRLAALVAPGTPVLFRP